ncbi:zinc finger protein 182 isoform X1 [Microplitis demolitor]|uniref:zinc finger protein 182 isoform X1 n=1 Tax=Microplitis demolitor TaxID=69319 RepID=UPI00235B5D45|nr:zinc finger protein 182 isoform X1 [Microplitis demolitor]
MMKVVCAASTCKYSSKNEDSSDIIFISFPNNEMSTVWAHNCGRQDLLIKSNEELHNNYYICSNHIEDRYFISKTNNTILTEGAVPTLFHHQLSINNESPSEPHYYELKQYTPETDNIINAMQLNNCINDVNDCPSNNFEDTATSNFENAIYSADLHGSNSSISTHINEINSNVTSIDSGDRNLNNYCNININIEQFDDDNNGSEDISVRYNSLCRLCGQSIGNGIDIFSDNQTNFKTIDKINLHLPIAVDSNDSMPRKICSDCYDKLEISHSLVITCLQTDIRLRKYFNLPTKYNNEDRYRELISLNEIEINNEICMDTSTVDELEAVTEKDKSSSIDVAELNNQVTESNPVIQTNQTVIQCPNNPSTKLDDRFKYVLQSDLNNLLLEPLALDSTNITNNTSENLNVENTVDNLIIDNNQPPQEQINCLNNANDKYEDKCEQGALTETSSHQDIVDPITEDIFNNDQTFDDTDVLYNDQRGYPAFRCKKCKDLFNKEEDLLIHDLYHTRTTFPDQERKCGHCSLSFFNRKDLQNHISDKHSGLQMLFKCGICDKIYEKWSSLDVHEATHRQDKPYLCDLCGKSFKHSNNLRGHKRTHLDITKKKRHNCEVCGNAFRSRFHLKEHMNQHNGDKPYKCEQCEKAFSKRIQLRQHRLSHGLNKHTCPICGVSFNRRGNMNTHMKRHNKDDGMYTCSVCECRFKSMSELKLHRKEHTDNDILESIKKKCNDKEIFQCKICSRAFPKRAALLNHERTHNGTQPRVECDICGKKLANKSSLKYHTKSIHTTERPHMCQFCGEAFVTKEARLIHERIHTGERPYVCKICNMQYRCSSNLSQHMKVHSEVRPYTCQYCNKSFTRKGALTIHERTHSGIKPFTCTICDKIFSQKYELIKHIKIHEIKTLSCEYCNEIFSSKTDISKHFNSVHRFYSNDSLINDKNILLTNNMQVYSLE